MIKKYEKLNFWEVVLMIWMCICTLYVSFSLSFSGIAFIHDKMHHCFVVDAISPNYTLERTFKAYQSTNHNEVIISNDNLFTYKGFSNFVGIDAKTKEDSEVNTDVLRFKKGDWLSLYIEDTMLFVKLEIGAVQIDPDDEYFYMFWYKDFFVGSGVEKYGNFDTSPNNKTALMIFSHDPPREYRQLLSNTMKMGTMMDITRGIAAISAVLLVVACLGYKFKN